MIMLISGTILQFTCKDQFSISMEETLKFYKKVPNYFTPLFYK